MNRKLLLAATALGLVGYTASVSAQGVYVNGVYTESGQSITVPSTGNVTIGGAPTFGTEYGSGGGQYQVTSDGYIAESQTHTTATGSTQSYTIPAGQSGTYNVVVPAAAPAVTYAEPVAYAAPAYAESRASGWAARGVYVGARAAISMTRDTEFTVDRADGPRSVKIDNEYDDPGYGGSLVVGYGARLPGWGYRVELEGGYQTAEVERHRLQGVGTFGSDVAEGDSKVLYGFVNVYGDLPITDRLALTAGGGVGAGRVTFDKHGVRGVGQVLDDDDIAFGYHLDAGMSYQLTESVAVEALYRYQQFVDAELKTENGNTEDVDLSSHNFIAGVRVGF